MTAWLARSAAVVVMIGVAMVGVVGYCAPQAMGSPAPVLNSPSIPAAPAPGMDWYADPVNGWSISYPFGWRVDPSNPAFVQIRAPRDQALVGIRVWTTDLPLNAVADQTLASDEELQRQSGVTNVVESRQLSVLPNGNPYVDVRVAREPSGRSHQIYVVKGGKAFGVNAETSVAAWDAFSGDFDRILLSFAPPR